jgi:hypothetical protein
MSGSTSIVERRMCKLQEIFTVFGAGRNLTGASPGKQPEAAAQAVSSQKV